MVCTGELVHSCFAVAGVAGILFTDLLRVIGISKLPVWYEAGATNFGFASTESLFVVQFLLMGFNVLLPSCYGFLIN